MESGAGGGLEKKSISNPFYGAQYLKISQDLNEPYKKTFKCFNEFDHTSLCCCSVAWFWVLLSLTVKGFRGLLGNCMLDRHVAHKG